MASFLSGQAESLSCHPRKTAFCRLLDLRAHQPSVPIVYWTFCDECPRVAERQDSSDLKPMGLAVGESKNPLKKVDLYTCTRDTGYTEADSAAVLGVENFRLMQRSLTTCRRGNDHHLCSDDYRRHITHWTERYAYSDSW